MKRTLSVAVLAVLLVPVSGAPALAPVSASPSPTSPVVQPAKKAHPLAVTGYALGETKKSVLKASAKALTTVTVVGVGISADGTKVEKPYAGMAAVRRNADRLGLRTELLVSNYSNDLGDFDTDAAHALLSSSTNISRLARTLAAYVRSGGYDGVNIDLELVQARDAAGLVQLAKALQGAMPRKKTVSIDLSASTSVAEYRNQGYALKSLGQVVDVVQLMTYDQHGPGWSGPGPIGDLRWQKKALAVLLTQVPRSKVDLGQAGYGYFWRTNGSGGEVTDRGARALVRKHGVKATWHPKIGEWSAKLPSGTKVWWADARSYALRKTLAREKRLHGLAVWVLGSADPLK